MHGDNRRARINRIVRFSKNMDGIDSLEICSSFMQRNKP